MIRPMAVGELEPREPEQGPRQSRGVLHKIHRAFNRTFLAHMPLDDFSDYNEYWEKRPAQPLLLRYRQVTDELPNEGRVLDIGCGDGTFLGYLKEHRPGLELMGIDLSEVAIRRLNERGISGQTCDIVSDGVPAELQADYVVMMEVIEHITDPEAVMQAIKRLGARKVYVSIPNLGHIEHRLRLMFGGKMPVTAILYHIKEHIRFWTVADFKHWADHMGYRVTAYRGQTGTLNLWRWWPSLFAMQITYTLEQKTRPQGQHVNPSAGHSTTDT